MTRLHEFTDKSLALPELFYGLKQILDIKGFSFICAFDPIVVGQILGETHKGFGSGLKFLEKIIDYPRWLPQPSSEGLRKLAHANLDKYCAFVPRHALESILPQLPQNPRAIKQYIRLLALLEPQISRHNPEELNWPVILLANVLKISFPQLAQDVVSDLSFWKDIDTAVMMHLTHSSDPDPIPPIIQSRVDKCKKISNSKLTGADSERLKALLEGLVECSNSTLDKANGFHYFLQIAEAPTAVTNREYVYFLNEWKRSTNQAEVAAWIVDHAKRLSFKEDLVFTVLLIRTINYRDTLLELIANAPTTQQMTQLLSELHSAMLLLEQLVFGLGGVTSITKQLTDEHLTVLLESFFRYFDWRSTKDYRTIRQKEEIFLMRLVTDWAGDVKPLMKAIQPLSPSHGAFASKRLNAFRMKLGKPILARFAHAITESFHVSGFGRSLAHADASNYDINRILLDPLGPFWRARRREVLSMLACAKTELTVQLNIYDLLHYLRGDYKNFASSGRAQDIAGILGNKKLSLALWKAATASPLNNRFVGEMRDYPEIVKGFGITLPIPRWWKAALKSLDRK